MKFNPKYEINGEKVYTVSQIKEILEYAAQCRLELALEFLDPKDSNAASRRNASDCLSYSNYLFSFANHLEDYLS